MRCGGEEVATAKAIRLMLRYSAKTFRFNQFLTMKLLTLEDYEKAGETFWPKYWYVAKELGEGAKSEDILKILESIGTVALRLKMEEKTRRLLILMIETDRKRKAKLSDSFGGTVEKNIPEDVEWIDDFFYIKETRFGLFTSILREPLGQHFITGATRDGVLTMTRWHLKSLQEGTLDDYTRVVNSGVVGGKL